MRRTDISATAARLALPSWRVARETTMTDLCTAFVDRSRAEGLSPATERYYRQACGHWLRFCDQRRLSEPRVISPDHLTAYSSWLQAGGNSKAVGGHLAARCENTDELGRAARLS